MASLKRYYYYYCYILRLTPLSEGAPSRFHLYILMHTPYCHILSSETLFCSKKSHLCMYVLQCFFPTQPLDRSWSHSLKHSWELSGLVLLPLYSLAAMMKTWVWISVPVSPSGSDKMPGFFLLLYSLLQIMGLNWASV